MGERTEAPPVAEEARRASEKTRSIATDGAIRLCFRVGNKKSHPRNHQRAIKKISPQKSLDFSRLLCFSALDTHSHEKKILNTDGI